MASPPVPLISKLVIIGVGLIGGSFALALRHAGIVKHIVGIGRSQINMQNALRLDIIDEQSTDFQAALSGADFVLLAVPVGQIDQVMQHIAPHLEKNAVISDVGSTKMNIVEAARTYLNDHLAHFVPAHPIAGTEFSGATAADTQLFQNKPFILTPLPENDPDAIEHVAKIWRHCGANIFYLQPERHDQMLAAISHLPHILSFLLMQHVNDVSDGKPMEFLQLAGSSLNDMTRIAGSSPEMWCDICLDNREILLTQIKNYQQKLSHLHQLLDHCDRDALQKLFSDARDIRRNWQA